MEGRLRTSQWTDGQDVTRRVTEIVADRVRFLTLRGGHANRAAEAEGAIGAEADGIHSRELST